MSNYTKCLDCLKLTTCMLYFGLEEINFLTDIEYWDDHVTYRSRGCNMKSYSSLSEMYFTLMRNTHGSLVTRKIYIYVDMT
jgi:hypothetical protein